jgi:hypothetical protein
MRLAAEAGLCPAAELRRDPWRADGGHPAGERACLQACVNTAGSKDALLRCADRLGMLWRTLPWTPSPTREAMDGRLEHCLKKCVTPAAMHTDRPCSARSLGTILSSLKMQTSPALAVQCPGSNPGGRMFSFCSCLSPLAVPGFESPPFCAK